ncbi:ferritin, heavy subunit-like [Myotis myotis]|uniref:ferritin, heavy subunit-like n=1 Tax=Myotis myotis TaxID=51298 RepID=UPI001749F9DA|nr:ferritin, heavy subunit-like [Myotis myotis]
MAAKHLLSECSIAINHLASYDAYLPMTCNSTEDSVEPLFANFFEYQAEVKWENGKQFLKHLRKCRSKICLLVFKRPEIDNWQTGIKALEKTAALESALELKNQLTKLLLDLKTTASSKNEYGILCILEKFLDEQNDDTNDLQFQLGYCKELEKQA